MVQDEGGKAAELMEMLVEPHVKSFDGMLGSTHEGGYMVEAIESVKPIIIPVPRGGDVKIWLENLEIGKPSHHRHKTKWEGSDRRPMYPRECREEATTYAASMRIDVCAQLCSEGGADIQRANNNNINTVKRYRKAIGELPIMVKSRRCNLNGMTRSELIKAKEHETEAGGYFIINGIERVIRMLILQRRHHILSVRRPAFTKRANGYTEFGVSIRCVGKAQIGHTIRCHYISDGTAEVAVRVRRNEYFIPAGILLKSFIDISDRDIFDRLVGSGGAKGRKSEQCAFAETRAELLLQRAARMGIITRVQALEHLGKHFRGVVGGYDWEDNATVGERLIQELVFCHLESMEDKLGLLVLCIHKLWAFVRGDCSEDSTDRLDNQELLLPGHLLTMVIKERFDSYLQNVSRLYQNFWEKSTPASGTDVIEKVIDAAKCDVGAKVEYMLATGNLVSQSGLELGQATGFTIVAERLNFLRYLSHFRCVHRGAYFAQMRTTTVRKLLPESWGFMCPVHTPDGAPCGLLTHLSQTCKVVVETHDEDRRHYLKDIESMLEKLGMMPVNHGTLSSVPTAPKYIPILINGKIVGHVAGGDAEKCARTIRNSKRLKSGNPYKDRTDLPWHVEVAYIPFTQGGPFPGIFIFTQAARMVRPVCPLTGGPQSIEYIGSLEQLFMNIKCGNWMSPDVEALAPSHREIDATSMLSVVASLTPWSDFNQSPRNMYQCQMGKQTMGTPCLNHPHNIDTKLYRIQTPQKPIAVTGNHRKFGIDVQPQGTNAVVAVLSYTGYDMEDAMIINKSSMERGFAHGSLYKTEQIRLKEDREGFARGDRKARASDWAIDEDGLPKVGVHLDNGDNYYSIVDSTTGRARNGKIGLNTETPWVDQVTLVGDGGKDFKNANIKLRYNRNPTIGDKFSSRHGQKGVLSQLWPDVDMPFCATTGIRPDIIINPHAYPSRMTIGMLIESLASKHGALSGEFVDATPFQERRSSSARCEDAVIEDYGSELQKKGFNYYGSETMISGVTGEEFTAQIFIGLVYYQRLRHMVSDKYQVRAGDGPINPLTKQPLKGRKMGGGIRFGEMERDSLLAHGAAYLAHDRLHACSDYHTTYMCTLCGSMLSTSAMEENKRSMTSKEVGGQVMCLSCQSSRGVELIALPYVFKYLASELCAMNIRCVLNISR